MVLAVAGGNSCMGRAWEVQMERNGKIWKSWASMPSQFSITAGSAPVYSTNHGLKVY
jgi:hypothetical protein